MQPIKVPREADALEAQAATERSGGPWLVFIPGIGGHPRFHSGFIHALSKTYRVRTGPHVDFFGPPCPDWDRHVEHWLARFHEFKSEQADDRRPVIVGVSFGAHIAVALRERLPTEALAHVVLVSYWPLAGWQRRGLGGLRTLRRTGSLAVGTVCFRWSEWRTHDVEELRSLRRELYDEELIVRRRLFARLVSLRSAPPPTALKAVTATSFVYARKEWSLRAMRLWHPGWRSECIALVDGDHSIALGGSAELCDAVYHLIECQRTA